MWPASAGGSNLHTVPDHDVEQRSVLRLGILWKQAFQKQKLRFRWLLKRKCFFCGNRKLAGRPVAEQQVSKDFSHPLLRVVLLRHVSEPDPRGGARKFALATLRAPSHTVRQASDHNRDGVPARGNYPQNAITVDKHRPQYGETSRRYGIECRAFGYPKETAQRFGVLLTR
jgi:hypothetical protein